MTPRRTALAREVDVAEQREAATRRAAAWGAGLVRAALALAACSRSEAPGGSAGSSETSQSAPASTCQGGPASV